MHAPSSSTEHELACLCNGIRFCKMCRNTDRVQKLFSGQANLRDAATVISNQQGDERTSSVSFALIEPSKYTLCPACACVYECPLARCCGDHAGIPISDVDLKGFFVVPEFVTPEEETAIVSFLDAPSEPFLPWKDSQSGRRKHEFGPKKNFKKRKVKPADIGGMPLALKPVLLKVSSTTRSLTGSDYTVAEASALEYVEERISNFDPHVDDTWLWGERIVGVNLLEECCMTFVDKSGRAVDAHLPRRCYFLMSGDSRYAWMHGIRPESVRNRRVSLTLRELSDEIAADTTVAEALIAAATTYL